MDPVTPAPAAPAQPAAPEAPATLPATHAAVASGSTTDYRAARRAERAGSPLAPVAVTTEAPAPVTPTNDDEPVTPSPAPATPASPERAVSKRQQQINDYERRIAEQDQRIRALEDSLRAPARPDPAAPAVPEKTEPEWKRYAAMPDAPKLADFDSVEEHTAAMAFFIADKRYEERQQAEHARSEGEQLAAVEHQRISAFDARVTDVAKTDPDIVSTIAPLAQRLGQAGGPSRIVGQLALDSEVGPQVLRHLAEHPDDLQRLVTLPAHLRALPERIQVRAHIQWMVREFAKLEGAHEARPVAEPPAPKTVTDMPEPPQTLGTRAAEATDPKVAAIKSGNTRAYREIRRHERAAATRR